MEAPVVLAVSMINRNSLNVPGCTLWVDDRVSRGPRRRDLQEARMSHMCRKEEIEAMIDGWT